ncbi:TPM domain-containing protein [Bacillus infantis]|uniref:TPM domain-containing protein n=1 Tax=Bacillus infantis TaxID=324767 RepID=UPI00101D6F55|nr:TPM domain-containing protein [Bacillus infantis]MCR6609173.1 TPM domain-containing protein [Bacillus infantis]RYI26990.1 TPM domain-containing protein [Bacillus infantis]
MIRHRAFPFVLALLLLFISAGAANAEENGIPAPSGDIYVQDFADVLSPEQENEIRSLGRSLEDRTTAQVAVLTVETTGGRPIEEYANLAFRQYAIGSAEENNGVLLVLAVKDKKARIEVGYGLEGRIPDGKAGRILDEVTFPRLEAGQPGQAVLDTYKTLAGEAAAEYGQGQGRAQPAGDQGTGIPSWLLFIIIVGVIVLDFMFFGGTLTYLLLSVISRGGGRGGGGGPRGGGGGSSGGGGASRGW